MHPIVTVQQGLLQGRIVTGHYGVQYLSFQGIPYAKPPIRELRFKAPQPPEPWSGTWDATAERSECYSRHMIFKHIIGAEDCLFLNVYTPQLPTSTTILKPVMVWIHGGGFTSGSGNAELYGPDFLVAEDVVVVTINYRLGLLGFLNMQDVSLEVPGNAGLKDQVMALKWVKKNIEQFCGDSNNITIFGESAGGTSVHYLMLSPMAKDLFHKAIIQSGSALSLRARGQPSAGLISNVLGLEKLNQKEILSILQEMTVEKLLELQEKFPEDFIASDMRPVSPVVEKLSNEPAFLSEEPIRIINSGRFNKVPLMIGYTTREGMLLELMSKRKYGKINFVKDFETAVPYTMQVKQGTELSKKIASKIKQFYYGTEEPSLENIDQYYLLQTDNFFLRPIHTTVKRQNAVTSTAIYFYRMSVDSALNIYKKIGEIKNQGVCHADDLGYLFTNELTPEIRPGSIEDVAVRRFAKLWTNFAQNGNPNPSEEDLLINVTWKPVQKGQLHFLDIGENLTVGINPEFSRMAFWDEIYSMSVASSLL